MIQFHTLHYNNSNTASHLHQVFKQEQFTNSIARNPSLFLPVIKTHFGEKSFLKSFQKEKLHFEKLHFSLSISSINLVKKKYFNNYSTFI